MLAEHPNLILYFLVAAVALTGLDGSNTVTWADNYQCRGSEPRLFDCPRGNRHDSSNCSRSDEAGVRCTGTTCTEGDIRLQGGNTTTGRVEICHNNIWGTVCNELWGSADARVACLQLGLPSSCI